jgi:hypothetical protein
MKYNRIAGLALCVATALSAGAASAATTWPANILGTYTGGANTASVQINITSQATGSPCVAIGGTLVDTGQNLSNPIVGYYCPKSGAIAFLRQDPSSGQTFQVYRGAFAFAQNGLTKKLAGTFGEYDALANLGEYPFTVSK